jgi:Raf kinase inhibitor-like YbhB/YbcL family protein
MASASCSTAIVRAFLSAGLTPNVEVGEMSPLHAAAGKGCLETAALLLEKGAKIDAQDNDGWTPLIKASSAGQLEMVRLLLEKGADLNVTDKSMRTAWTYAAMANHTEIAALFRELRGAPKPPPGPLGVSSPVLTMDQPMPREYTADGHNWSPPINWNDAPTDTKSFAVVLQDPDAGNPPPFVHWVIYNIPATATGLPENVPFEPGAAMPSSIKGAVQGVSGFRRPIYRGPAPPPGKPHHYHFDVYALDLTGLKDGLSRAEFLDAIKGHILAQGEIVPIYERKP